jgi:hypothetical protein
MTTVPLPDEKPGLVTAIAVMTLINGIVNIFWGLTVTMTLFWTLVCLPVGLLQTALGIFEIVYAAKLLGSSPQPMRPSTNIAVLEIVCVLTGNVFSMIVGILSLVFYNDPAVKDYFTRLNGPTYPAPITPPAPRPPEPPATPSGPRKVA